MISVIHRLLAAAILAVLIFKSECGGQTAEETVTLPERSPADFPVYDHWVRYYYQDGKLVIDHDNALYTGKLLEIFTHVYMCQEYPVLVHPNFIQAANWKGTRNFQSDAEKRNYFANLFNFTTIRRKIYIESASPECRGPYGIMRSASKYVVVRVNYRPYAYYKSIANTLADMDVFPGAKTQLEYYNYRETPGGKLLSSVIIKSPPGLDAAFVLFTEEGEDEIFVGVQHCTPDVMQNCGLEFDELKSFNEASTGFVHHKFLRYPGHMH